MPKIPWKKWLQSWWGRMLAGAALGTLLVGFSGIAEPAAYVVGMVVGAAALFLLGEWK
jgi:hypothetical protein